MSSTTTLPWDADETDLVTHLRRFDDVKFAVNYISKPCVSDPQSAAKKQEWLVLELVIEKQKFDAINYFLHRNAPSLICWNEFGSFQACDHFKMDGKTILTWVIISRDVPVLKFLTQKLTFPWVDC